MNRLPGVLLRTVLLLMAALLPSAWPLGVPRADLVVLVVAAAAMTRGSTTGLLVGLAGGWLVDLVPPGAEPLGASALCYAAVGALLGLARRYVVTSPMLPWLVTAAAAGLVLAVRGVTAAAGVGRVVPGELLWSWLLTLLVSVVALPLLLSLERRLSLRRWA